jgi:hypothetical protein
VAPAWRGARGFGVARCAGGLLLLHLTREDHANRPVDLYCRTRLHWSGEREARKGLSLSWDAVRNASRSEFVVRRSSRCRRCSGRSLGVVRPRSRPAWLARPRHQQPPRRRSPPGEIKSAFADTALDLLAGAHKRLTPSLFQACRRACLITVLHGLPSGQLRRTVAL